MKRILLVLLAGALVVLVGCSTTNIEGNKVSGKYYGSTPLEDSWAAANLAAAEIALQVAEGKLDPREAAEFMAVFSLAGIKGHEKKIHVYLRKWEHVKTERGLSGFDRLAQEHKKAADSWLEKARQEKAAREVSNF